MTTRFTTENLKSVFTFPFKDEHWQGKLAILALLGMASILFIPMFFLYGYIYEVMRRIIVDKEEPSLPEWNDWGGFFMNGLKMIGVFFVYALPSTAFSFVGAVVGAALILIYSADPSLSLLPAAAFPISISMTGLGSAVSMVLGPFLFTATGHVVAKGEFSAAFRVREWWPVFRRNIGGFILTYLFMTLGTMIGVFAMQFLLLTIVLICFAPVVWGLTFSYSFLVSGVLFAQAYNDGTEEVSLSGI